VPLIVFALPARPQCELIKLQSVQVCQGNILTTTASHTYVYVDNI